MSRTETSDPGHHAEEPAPPRHANNDHGSRSSVPGAVSTRPGVTSSHPGTSEPRPREVPHGDAPGIGRILPMENGSYPAIDHPPPLGDREVTDRDSLVRDSQVRDSQVRDSQVTDTATDPTFARPGHAPPTVRPADPESEASGEPVTVVDQPTMLPFTSEGPPERHEVPEHHRAGAGTVAQIAVDFFACAAALPIALVGLSLISNVTSNGLERFASNMAVDALFPFMAVAALAVSGFYRTTRRTVLPSTFVEIKDLAFAIGAGALMTMAFGLIAHATLGIREPAAAQIISGAILAIVLVTLARAAYQALRRTTTTTRVMLVGSGDLVFRIETYLGLLKGTKLVGRVVDEAVPDADALGTVADLPRLCEELRVDRLVVAFPASMSQESVEIFRSLQDEVRISMVPRYFELISWRSRLTDLYGLPLLEVAPRHLSLWDRAIKRLIDLFMGGLALLVVSPVMVIVAICVKLTSPGPVFFRQVRLGRNRQPFTISKFRTMKVETDSANEGGSTPPHDSEEPGDIAQSAAASNAASQPLFEVRNKVQEKDRLTSVGAFFRRTALDELPQLFNVITGHMSLVGPRPFVPHESEDLDGWASRRFEVRPGITGLWQVSGRNNLTAQELRRLDYLYVASWSMWWDLKILWDTPKALAHGLGAY